jgi:hypothetical protein
MIKILFPVTQDHYKLGRIWVNPGFQNQGKGQVSMQAVFPLYPQILMLTPGIPVWAGGNQPFL